MIRIISSSRAKICLNKGTPETPINTEHLYEDCPKGGRAMVVNAIKAYIQTDTLNTFLDTKLWKLPITCAGVIGGRELRPKS